MPDRTTLPPLTVRAIRATPVEVPLNFVLGTSQGRDKADLGLRAAPAPRNDDQIFNLNSLIALSRPTF